MIVADYPLQEFAALARAGRLFLRTGPFVVQIESDLESGIAGLHSLYADHELSINSPFADFRIALNRSSRWRSWGLPRATFVSESNSVFEPFPRNSALAYFEWGLNGCVCSRANDYLMFHAAAVEREDVALVLPAPSGSGKSTLTAALVFSGWRLLSDELTLVTPTTGQITALARPIMLKNASIEVIRDRFPSAVFARLIAATIRGRVAQIRPPRASVEQCHLPARPAHLVCPQFQAGARTELTPISRSDALRALLNCTLNFSLFGEAGFQAAADLVERCTCQALTFGCCEDAAAALSQWLPTADRSLPRFAAHSNTAECPAL